MSKFLNEKLKEFIDLNSEDQLIIIEAVKNNNLQIYDGIRDSWRQDESKHVSTYEIYRTTPQKELNIPWELLHPKWEWAAMDEDLEVYVYEDEPEDSFNYWYNPRGDYLKITDLFANPIDIGGIDWEESLTQRPEGK